MARRLILVVIAAALLSRVANAQMRGGSRGFARGAYRYTGSRHNRDAYARGYFVGDTPFLYDDYPFGSATPEPTLPQLVLQSMGAADVPSAKIAPLLIELQGDRYVRYGGVARPAQPDAGTRGVSTFEATSRSTIARSQIVQQDLPPTVLVYRDSHREEVADYAIVGRVIYVHRAGVDDGQPEYGLKSIQVSALDISATVKVNRESGVSFVLPAGPNQVVTRP